jgi:ubiquinone/menaquinone biosynthesis C-methylase UbiE
MARDPYERFAARYDLFFHDSDEHELVKRGFFRKLFEENNVRSVLDCACGTGRDLAMFHSLGLKAEGADVSAAMLTEARDNLTKHGLSLPLNEADYRELPKHFDRRFDAVVCLSSSIVEMPNELEALKAFRSMREVLRWDGLLIVTQGTTDKQWEKKPRFIPAVNTKDFSRVFVIDYIKKGARYNVLDIFHGDNTPDFKVWGIDYPRIFLKDDHERLLKAAGFRVMEFYGTYNRDRYDKNESDLLIIVAYK